MKQQTRKTPAKKQAAKQRGAPSKAVLAVKIIALLLVLALLGGAVYFAAITDGFTRSEYITYKGEKLGATSRQTRLQYGENVFEIKSVNPFAGEIGYTVKIMPNPEATFNFNAGDNPISFTKLGELTDCFDIETEPSKITLTISADMTLKRILKTKYPDDELTLPDEMPNAELFVMSVTYTNGKGANIYFDIPSWTISIDPPHIIF